MKQFLPFLVNALLCNVVLAGSLSVLPFTVSGVTNGGVVTATAIDQAYGKVLAFDVQQSTGSTNTYLCTATYNATTQTLLSVTQTALSARYYPRTIRQSVLGVNESTNTVELIPIVGATVHLTVTGGALSLTNTAKVDLILED